MADLRSLPFRCERTVSVVSVSMKTASLADLSAPNVTTGGRCGIEKAESSDEKWLGRVVISIQCTSFRM